MEAEQQEIKLDKPGAGIPFFDRIYGKYILMPKFAKQIAWNGHIENFVLSCEKIKKEIEGLSDEQMQKKVLVEPIKGLEDSSRYWSIAMTLEHMVIVGLSVSRVIVELSHKQKLNQVVDIAKVKPPGKMNAQAAKAAFEKLSLEVPEFIKANVDDRNSKITHKHPWFGQMTARQWLWLLGSHQFIHLKQIRQIKQNQKN